MAELEKLPTADTSVNKPASGTYGEKAEVDRLKKSLPSTGATPGAPTPGPAPMPGSSPVPPTGDPGRPGVAPPGVPSVVMGPSNRPNVPLTGAPGMGGPQVSPMGSARSQTEARMVLLDALASSPDVSAETREWARLVLEMMARD